MDKVRIDRRWLPLNALRAFEGVARYGSFTGAASALNIAQSALSRHVISLENLIGVKLFERRPHSTRAHRGRPAPAAGRFPVFRSAGARHRRNPRFARHPRLRTLRVQMPPSFAAHMFVPILQDFRQRKPRGRNRPREPVRHRPAGRRRRRRRAVFAACRHRPGQRPALAGAARDRVPPRRRRACTRARTSRPSSATTNSCTCASRACRDDISGRSSCSTWA